MNDSWRLNRYVGVRITHNPTGTVRECGAYKTAHENSVSAWAAMNAALEVMPMDKVVFGVDVVVTGTVSPEVADHLCTSRDYVSIAASPIDPACAVDMAYTYKSEPTGFDIDMVAKQFNEGIIISRDTWAKVIALALTTVKTRPVAEKVANHLSRFDEAFNDGIKVASKWITDEEFCHDPMGATALETAATNILKLQRPVKE